MGPTDLRLNKTWRDKKMISCICLLQTPFFIPFIFKASSPPNHRDPIAGVIIGVSDWLRGSVRCAAGGVSSTNGKIIAPSSWSSFFVLINIIIVAAEVIIISIIIDSIRGK